MPWTMNRKLSEVVVTKNISGEYVCEGASGKGNTVKFLVPVSTFSKILEHVDRDILEGLVRSLFEAMYDQRGGHSDNLGVLDGGEVDGLFSVIRAKKRREAGGWTNVAGGTGKA